MFNYLFLKLKSTNGFAFPLVLLSTVLVVSLLVVGLTPMITTQAKHVVHTEDQLKAKYTAEAGVKRGLREVYDILSPTTGEKPNPNETATVSLNDQSLLKTGGVKYSYEYKYFPGENNKPSNPERIQVIAKATANKVTTESMAWIVFDSSNIPGYQSPDLIDLITSANSDNELYCHHYESDRRGNYQKDWLFGTDEAGRTYGTPVDGMNKNYILFNDDPESSEFRIDYNVKFEKSAKSSPGGLGVIYGASEDDTAYSFAAYCVKFNNARQAFSVTKFYKTTGDGPNRDPKEYFIANDMAGESAVDPKNTEANQAMFQPNGTDEYGNKLGNCSITYTDLKKTIPGFNPDEICEYTITIKTEIDRVEVHESKTKSHFEDRLRHKIYLKNTIDPEVEPILVLDFFDMSDVNPVTKNDSGYDNPQKRMFNKNPRLDLERKLNPDRQIRTGLRVVNVNKPQFYNSNIDQSRSVKGIRRIIWKK